MDVMDLMADEPTTPCPVTKCTTQACCDDYALPPMITTRFIMVSIIGSIVGLIGTLESLILFYVFSSKFVTSNFGNYRFRKHHRTSYNLYMMLLAIFDTFVSVSYIPLMGLNVLGDYLIDPFLVKLWYESFRPVFTISHIGITASAFLIVAATFERYCITLNSRWLKTVQRHRISIASAAVIMGVISKGSVGLEFQVARSELCVGTMQEYSIGLSDFATGWFNDFIRLWYRNVATIIAPFVILFVLNFLIVSELQSQPQMAVCTGKGAPDINKRKVARRNATKSLVLVVMCYLLSNLFSVIATVWENLDAKNSRNEHEYWKYVYAFIIDLASLLSVVACAFRLPILTTCQHQIRDEVKDVLRRIFRCQSTNHGESGDHEQLVTSGQSSHHATDDHFDRRTDRKSVTLTLTLPIDANGNSMSSSNATNLVANGKHFSIDGICIYYSGSESLL